MSESVPEDVLYERLRGHIGHRVELVCYGADGEAPANIAVECADCGEVVVDATERRWREATGTG